MLRGKRLGRGLDYFRQESTHFNPAPIELDPHEDEAHRLWKLKRNWAAKDASRDNA